MVSDFLEAIRNVSVQCNATSNGSLATLKDQLVNFVLLDC